jgi:hypothetical protein
VVGGGRGGERMAFFRAQTKVLVVAVAKLSFWRARSSELFTRSVRAFTKAGKQWGSYRIQLKLVFDVT